VTLNIRIKQVRQALNLSQAKFAKGISISNGYIAGIELGNRRVNERIIRLIGSTYDVSEIWLKTGEGEMFNDIYRDKLAKVIDYFKQLEPAFQDYILNQIDQLLLLQNSRTKEADESIGEGPGEGH